MSQHTGPTTPVAKSDAAALIWQPILLGRLLMLLFAAGAVLVAVVATGPAQRAAARFVCPMHPEVTSAVSGACPICLMQLTAVSTHDSGAAPATASPTYSSYCDVVRRRSYAYDIRGPAWVESDGVVAAIIYREDVVGLGPQERGEFSREEAPGLPVAIHLLAEPPAPWDRSTSRVRFRIDGPAPADALASPRAVAGSDAAAGATAGQPAAPERRASAIAIRPGEVGWVRLAGQRREVHVIPNAAVLWAPEGPYVLVASADGRTLTKRPVEIGKVFAGITVVLSGVRPPERVVIRDAFFLDAERRLHTDPTPEVRP